VGGDDRGGDPTRTAGPGSQVGSFAKTTPATQFQGVAEVAKVIPSTGEGTREENPTAPGGGGNIEGSKFQFGTCHGQEGTRGGNGRSGGNTKTEPVTFEASNISRQVGFRTNREIGKKGLRRWAKTDDRREKSARNRSNVCSTNRTATSFQLVGAPIGLRSPPRAIRSRSERTSQPRRSKKLRLDTGLT